MTGIPVAAHAAHYARIVRNDSIRRSLRRKAEEILRDASSGAVPGPELAARAKSLFEEESDKAAKTVFPVRSFAELMREDFMETYYIDGLLVQRQPLVMAGPMKALKTSLLMAMAFAIATAIKFLDKFNVNRAASVAVLSAESGGKALRSLLKRIAERAGFDPLDLDPQLYVGEDIPTIGNPEH